MSQKRYRYTGKEKDDETGLYYHGARFLAPWLGRWVSSDPIGIGDGVNRFAYVHGNPIRGRDPTGTEERLENFAQDNGNWYELRDAARNLPSSSLLQRVEKLGALGGAKLGVAVEDFSAMGHNPDVVVQELWQATPVAAAIEGASTELAKGGSGEEVMQAADRAFDERVDALMLAGGEMGLSALMLGPNAAKLGYQTAWGKPDPLTSALGGDPRLEARLDAAIGSTMAAGGAAGLLVPLAGASPTRWWRADYDPPTGRAVSPRLEPPVDANSAWVTVTEEFVARESAGIRVAIADLAPGKNRAFKVVDSPEDLRALFDKLSSRGELIESPGTYKGEMVRLPGGTRIGFRLDSKSGGDAIDITFVDETYIKVHIQQ